MLTASARLTQRCTVAKLTRKSRAAARSEQPCRTASTSLCRRASRNPRLPWSLLLDQSFLLILPTSRSWHTSDLEVVALAQRSLMQACDAGGLRPPLVLEHREV